MWKGITIIITALLIVIISLVNSNRFWDILFPVFYKDVLVKYSNEYKIDPLLAASIIKVESSFYSGAKSPKGAVGLMQIMPDTGREIAIKLGIRPFTNSDLYDPEVNIRIGLYYLARLRKEFDGNIPLTLAAYNGGKGNVKKWLKERENMSATEYYNINSIPFPETRNFVQAVLWNYKWLKNVQRVRNLFQFKEQHNDFS